MWKNKFLHIFCSIFFLQKISYTFAPFISYLIRADYLLTVSKKIEMTTCNNTEEKINSLLQKKEFDSLYELFEEQKYSLNDFFVFYKRSNKSKKIFDLPEFWKSKLPHFHLKDVVESDLKVTFYKSYFSKNENCNPELNQHLICISKDDFIKHFKLWKAFGKDTFFESFKQIANSNSEFERVVREFEIILKVQAKIDSELNQLKEEFTKFSLDDVLLGYALFYYAVKHDVQILGNRNLQVQYEVELIINELNFILSAFSEKDKLRVDFSKNEDIQKILLQYINLTKNQQISLLIKRMMDVTTEKGKISLYLSEYADFMSVVLNPAILETNKFFNTFQFNNQKSRLEEMYFMDIDFKNLKGRDILLYSKITKTLDFYGIPKNFEYESKQIDFLKVLKLSYAFKTNKLIILFEYEYLLEEISQKLNWTKEETKNIIDFLTLDFKTDKLPENWISQPFLRFENKILWLNSFCMGRRWENILLNRLMKDKSIAKTYATNFEKQIEKLFIENSL